jgi:hypothetical protein
MSWRYICLDDSFPEDICPEEIYPKDFFPEDICPDDICSHPGKSLTGNCLPGKCLPAKVMEPNYFLLNEDYFFFTLNGVINERIRRRINFINLKGISSS